MAPLTGEGSLIRGARLFHPDGVVVRAEVQSSAREGALGELGRRLEGPAFVRLSSAWWRRDRELPDVLGVAVRLSERDGFVEGGAPRDQDLLFALVSPCRTLPFAPLTTNVHDFSRTSYYAVLPLDALRARAREVAPRAAGRVVGGQDEARAARVVVARGGAALRLEVKSTRLGASWQELAVIELREIVQVDRAALAFTPFHAGRGLEPVGFFQMIRAATYAASRRGRKVVND